MDDCPGFIQTDGGLWFIGRMKRHTCGGRGERMLHHSALMSEKAGVFHDESRKGVPSARGQGGSVAGDVDKLSQQWPLPALCPNLCRKWGETGIYFPLLHYCYCSALTCSVTSSCQHSALYDLAQNPFSLLSFLELLSICLHFIPCSVWTLEQQCVQTTFQWACLPFWSSVQSNPLPNLFLVPDEFEVALVLKSINLSRARLHGPSSSSFYCDEGCNGRIIAVGGVIWITS